MNIKIVNITFTPWQKPVIAQSTKNYFPQAHIIHVTVVSACHNTVWQTHNSITLQNMMYVYVKFLM